MTSHAASAPFFGRRVVAAAFVVAVFGWGLGFYGPPVYLQSVREARDWSVVLVSSAVTLHFLVGAVVVANLPSLYHRFGFPVAAAVIGAIMIVTVWFLADRVFAHTPQSLGQVQNGEILAPVARTAAKTRTS